MVTGIIDEAQRKAARVAGVAFLLTMAIVVAVNFAINQRRRRQGSHTFSVF